MATRLTSVDDLKDYLQIPSAETALDARLASYAEAASAEYESFCNRIASQAPYSNEAHRGGGNSVVVRNPPIDSGSTLQVKNFDGVTLTILDPSDYYVDYARGIITLIGSNFSQQPNGAQVTYTGGFASSGTGTALKHLVTADIAQSVRELAAAMHKKATGAMTQEDVDKVRAYAEATWSGDVA